MGITLNKSRMLLGLLAVVTLTGMGWVAWSAQSPLRVRRPICPGLWYPADAAQLHAAVQQYLNEAQVEPRSSRVSALVVPNSSYAQCGRIAAQAFKLVDTGQYDRIIVLTPSHHTKFRGCSIAAVQAYLTPLGGVALDGAAIQKVTLSTLITRRSLSYNDARYAKGERLPLHEIEHGDEVVLPFLQERIGWFEYVPIVVGDLVDYDGDIDEHTVEAVANSIRKIIDARTLLVISTNFTQYGVEYGHVPFTNNVLQNIEQLDRMAFEALLSKDYRKWRGYFEETGNHSIPGEMPLAILIKLLSEDSVGALLAYDTSGRINGNTDTSISYASFAFFEPREPAAAPKPERALPIEQTLAALRSQPSASDPAAPPAQSNNDPRD